MMSDVKYTGTAKHVFEQAGEESVITFTETKDQIRIKFPHDDGKKRIETVGAKMTLRMNGFEVTWPIHLWKLSGNVGPALETSEDGKQMLAMSLPLPTLGGAIVMRKENCLERSSRSGFDFKFT